MDQGLNLTNSLYLASATGHEVSSPNRTVRDRPASDTRSAPDLAPASPVRQANYRDTVIRSGKRLEVASAAVDQIRDLVASVSAAVVSNRELPGAEIANHRLLASAHAAAQDIIDHAKSDGENLFGSPRRGSTLARTAQAAYSAQQSHFRSEAGFHDGSRIAEAIGQTRASLTGPSGVLQEFQRLSGEFVSEADLLNTLHEVDQRLMGVKDDLSKVQATEVTQTLANLASGVSPAGLPFDLQV